MNMLMILNEPPYGSERIYNGLRMVKALSSKDVKLTVFLMADAVFCAKHGQRVPEGFYNIELMINAVLRKGQVLLYGTCMQARGLKEEELLPDARISTMPERAELTLAADKVLVF